MAEPDEDAPPVRVKVYGLVHLSRRTYLIIQGVGLVVVPGLLLAAYLLPRPRTPVAQLPFWQQFLVRFLDWTPWMALLILIVEPIETYFVLRRFAHKQAEQQPPRRQPTPPVPTP
jgi:hypothetical protein